MIEAECRPIRVLHIFKKMDRGGAEMRTLDVMRAIDRDEFQLDFCSLSGRRGELDQAIADLGGRTHLCKLDILFPARLIRLLRKERYDVVHSHVLLVSGYILLLSYLAGVPGRIAHFRSTGNGAPIGRVRALRDRLLRFLIDKTATSILAVSHGAMEAVWTAYKPNDERCQVVYNGIDLGQYEDLGQRQSTRDELGISPDTTVFVHVGRFDEAKNHERLIEIFSKVRERSSSSILLLVGGGSSSREAAIRARMTDLGLSELVKFLGVREDVPALLLAADAMIFPSRWEGLPGVVLEACAAGLPVVASDLPGVMEIAAQIPLVHALSLTVEDGLWAEIAVGMAQERRDRKRQPGDVNPISSTDFSMDTSRLVLEKIWRESSSIHDGSLNQRVDAQSGQSIKVS